MQMHHTTFFWVNLVGLWQTMTCCAQKNEFFSVMGLETDTPEFYAQKNGNSALNSACTMESRLFCNFPCQIRAATPTRYVKSPRSWNHGILWGLN